MSMECCNSGYHEFNLDWFMGQFRQLWEKVNSIQTDGGAIPHIYYADDIEDWHSFIGNEPQGILIFNNPDVNHIYHIPDNIVFPENLDILALAGLISGSPKILGQFYAPAARVFAEDFAGTCDGVGRPEWFGAKTGDAAYNNVSYINRCIAAFRTTMLAPEDYYIAGTIYINQSRKTVIGSGVNQTFLPDGEGDGSRIIQTGAVTALNIGGGDVYADSIVTIRLREFSITAYEPDYSVTSAGITLNGVRDFKCNNITVSNFKLGYNISNIVLSYIEHCRYLCDKPSSDVNNATGFNINTLVNLPVGISSMVSLYLNDNDVEFTNQGDSNTGIYCSGVGNVADLLINGNNFVQCGTGIYLDCTHSTDNLQQNIWVRDNCIDNCGVDGIRIDGPLKAGIIGNWISCGSWGASTKHGYYHTSGASYNAVVFTGNLLKSAGGTAYGIRVVGCRSEDIAGALSEWSNPVFISSSENIKCDTEITADSDREFNGVNAIIFESCHSCQIGGSIRGEKEYKDGCQLLTSQMCQVNPARYESLSGSKVVIAATAIANDSIFKALADGNTVIAAAE